MAAGWRGPWLRPSCLLPAAWQAIHAQCVRVPCSRRPAPPSLQEPALNPALEEQAIGRAWRMGEATARSGKACWALGAHSTCMKLTGASQLAPS